MGKGRPGRLGATAMGTEEAKHPQDRAHSRAAEGRAPAAREPWLTRGHTAGRGRGGEDTWPRASPPQSAREERAAEERRMGLGPGARGVGRGSAPGAPGAGLGSRSPSPPARRRASAGGGHRRGAHRDAGRRSPPQPRGAPSAHLSRERPQGPEPRSSRVAASTTAAILGLRPPLLSSLPAPPPGPRPPGAGPRRSGSRCRCAGRKQRPEARSGGRAAGDGGGRLGPRPGRSRGHGAAAAGLERAGAAGPAAMAGYARRPGVTPLSRARSLVIPDGEQRRAGGSASAARRPC